MNYPADGKRPDHSVTSDYIMSFYTIYITTRSAQTQTRSGYVFRPRAKHPQRKYVPVQTYVSPLSDVSSESFHFEVEAAAVLCLRASSCVPDAAPIDIGLFLIIKSLYFSFTHVYIHIYTYADCTSDKSTEELINVAIYTYVPLPPRNRSYFPQTCNSGNFHLAIIVEIMG